MDLLIEDLKESVLQHDMSYAVSGKVQLSDEGVVQPEAGGDDEGAMTLVVMMCHVRKR